ncbi:MAG: hypothetical protein A2W93_02740 [Bacteroidetes bacterium GWF2_43_63]|nr:MAG: hypothetical protein A2W94_08745 [Bacteroidetes bacterium GWE2_42_42]OFY53585.1 MAG: hypothetical protein A2W93_02740 [Bacteroidetes bacterium GWF2_43_63]HBG71082.1 hypothetical protein [Bacteroidales bacterium]HCB63660.1 hypothetical protein [Bacteroidales bacterium]HCY24409.1 hypothetical protein [Bacteroidales bacterium]
MKNLKIFAVLLLVMGMIAVSCEGPEGPRGPAGTAGTNGTDGNANVIVCGFPGDTMTTAHQYNYLILPVSAGMMDSSLIIPYLHQYNWYPVGGLGYGGYYNTRYWITSLYNEVGVAITNPDGSSYTGADQIWDSLRVFIIPASQFHAAESKVNFANYYEVEDYFSQK